MRQEHEQGPCCRHMDAFLQMVPSAVYPPGCDRKGFYKRKQCKPSLGHRCGICWFVDEHGMKLPGTDLPVMGIKEGVYCMEHWVLYANNESWNTTSKTKNVLYGD
uniref:Thyroglobulin type-1 domain-containing protein n=1 Tax=Ursus americanus TaxID=9643 RepID=A0A452R1A1_URSAM